MEVRIIEDFLTLIRAEWQAPRSRESCAACTSACGGPAAMLWRRSDDEERHLRSASERVDDFVAPPPNTYGNRGRGILYGPGHVNFDTSLSKRVAAAGRTNIEFRWDAFNLFNIQALVSRTRTSTRRRPDALRRQSWTTDRCSSH